MARKSPKFHGASANGFGCRSENHRGGAIRPPPTSNRVKGVPTTKSFLTHMVDVIDYSAEYRVDAPAVCRTIAGQK